MLNLPPIFMIAFGFASSCGYPRAQAGSPASNAAPDAPFVSRLKETSLIFQMDDRSPELDAVAVHDLLLVASQPNPGDIVDDLEALGSQAATYRNFNAVMNIVIDLRSLSFGTGEPFLPLLF